MLSASVNEAPVPAHNVFRFGGVCFSSNFDSGNLSKVERIVGKEFDFKIWTAPDNMGTTYQSKHCAWFHFQVSGISSGVILRIHLANTGSHAALYKHDMRPVFRSNSTNQKWARIKNSVKFLRNDDGSTAQLIFEHLIDVEEDKLFFAFTYPYSYSMLQNDLAICDNHKNDFENIDSIICYREILTYSCDNRRIDLITITSPEGNNCNRHEPLLSGLFPTNNANTRPVSFPNKKLVFISARVHPGEVPAQHTWKGIFNLLMDKNDLRAKELRRRYVFLMIPMLNPDGVFRGHFRMDQHGQNLNRYYHNPDCSLQPAIFGAKSLLDYYSQLGTLSCYIDMHAHASKRGCFIYGNVMDKLDDQIQNQLFCKLIALNSPHFDYEGCLFSREHMTRIDPGDQASGLTAEGSGRVWTYLAHGILHSYTIECNYNTSKATNEVPPTDSDPGGQYLTPQSNYSTLSEKYTPASYAGVGRACLIAILDIRNHNPCSRIPKSKYKNLDRLRMTVLGEVRVRKEYKGQPTTIMRRKSHDAKASSMSDEATHWKRVVSDIINSSVTSSNDKFISITSNNSSRLLSSTSTSSKQPQPLPLYDNSSSYLKDDISSYNSSEKLSSNSSSIKSKAPPPQPPARKLSIRNTQTKVIKNEWPVNLIGIALSDSYLNNQEIPETKSIIKTTSSRHNKYRLDDGNANGQVITGQTILSLPSSAAGIKDQQSKSTSDNNTTSTLQLCVSSRSTEAVLTEYNSISSTYSTNNNNNSTGDKDFQPKRPMEINKFQRNNSSTRKFLSQQLEANETLVSGNMKKSVGKHHQDEQDDTVVSFKSQMEDFIKNSKFGESSHYNNAGGGNNSFLSREIQHVHASLEESLASSKFRIFPIKGHHHNGFINDQGQSQGGQDSSSFYSSDNVRRGGTNNNISSLKSTTSDDESTSESITSSLTKLLPKLSDFGSQKKYPKSNINSNNGSSKNLMSDNTGSKILRSTGIPNTVPIHFPDPLPSPRSASTSAAAEANGNTNNSFSTKLLKLSHM